MHFARTPPGVQQHTVIPLPFDAQSVPQIRLQIRKLSARPAGFRYAATVVIVVVVVVSASTTGPNAVGIETLSRLSIGGPGAPAK